MDNRQCKKCGRNLTETEYTRFNGFCVDCKILNTPASNSNKNRILSSVNVSLILKIIVLIEFVAGFIAGCMFGIEKESFLVALAWWLGIFISGFFTLSVAKIIDLLTILTER